MSGSFNQVGFMDGVEFLTQMVIKALDDKEKNELELYKEMLKIAEQALEDLDSGELSNRNMVNNISRRAWSRIQEIKKTLTR